MIPTSVHISVSYSPVYEGWYGTAYTASGDTLEEWRANNPEVADTIKPHLLAPDGMTPYYLGSVHDLDRHPTADAAWASIADIIRARVRTPIAAVLDCAGQPA